MIGAVSAAQNLWAHRERKTDMGKTLRYTLMAALVLSLTLFALGQKSAADERKRGPQAHPDAEALALVARARIDLVRRLGMDANQIALQSIEATEFPDGSLGAPELNTAYPLATTPGLNIRLKVGEVVYRYWAASGRVVYVGSFVEPPSAGESQLRRWAR
jgi:hypothetical protein